MAPVPYRADLTRAPDGAVPIWRTASDGVRLRLAYWQGTASKGTILLFPGRTEHIEKYGGVVRDLVLDGFAVITLDWRGQGFSDRLSDDPKLGHVNDFADYQMDVAEMVAAAQSAGLPKPWHLLAHSMGGCVALRSLIEDLPVKRAVLSAPMLGVRTPPALRFLPYVAPPIFRLIGLHETYTPGTRPRNYVAGTKFDENLLTTDRARYKFLARQMKTEPAFALGGPSIHWVGRAAVEWLRLVRLPRPETPVLTFLGSNEGVVPTHTIHRLHSDWPTARLRIVPDARHELMMEAPAHRDLFFRETLEFFNAA